MDLKTISTEELLEELNERKRSGKSIVHIELIDPRDKMPSVKKHSIGFIVSPLVSKTNISFHEGIYSKKKEIFKTGYGSSFRKEEVIYWFYLPKQMQTRIYVFNKYDS